MYKNKDGKVIASLTEVKNKTGDIFAIVDEFGEISLTSYNKIRYKIVKVEIENIVDINEDGPEARIATSEKKRNSTPKLEVKDEPAPKAELEVIEDTIEEIKEAELETKPAIEEVPIQEEIVEDNKLFNRTIAIETWDREGKTERQFSLNAIRPLIS